MGFEPKTSFSIPLLWEKKETFKLELIDKSKYIYFIEVKIWSKKKIQIYKFKNMLCIIGKLHTQWVDLKFLIPWPHPSTPFFMKGENAFFFFLDKWLKKYYLN